MKMTLIMMYGYPSSGKSTLANRIGKKLGYSVIRSAQTNASGEKVKSSIESIDESIPEMKASRDRLYRRRLELGEEAIKQGKSVILDATFHKFYWRKWVYDVAKRLNLSPIIIWVIYKGDLHVLEERKRNPDPEYPNLDSYEQYKKMVSQTENLSNAELDKKYVDIRVIKYNRIDNTVTLINCEEDSEIRRISSAILSPEE